MQHYDSTVQTIDVDYPADSIAGIDPSLLADPQYVALFKDGAERGFEIGVQTALGYMGKFAYVPIAALMVYSLVRKIRNCEEYRGRNPIKKKFTDAIIKMRENDIVIIKGNGKFKRLTVLEIFESTSLALSLAAAGAMAWIFYTQGAALQLKFF